MSTIMAIQVVVVWKLILPVTLIALTGGLATTIMVIFLGRRLFSYNIERSVTIYGTVTGTVSSGLLLRIVDPEFKSPVAVEVGIMNLFMVPVILGYSVLINAPIWWHWSLPLTVGVFGVALIISLLLMKLLKLVEAPKF